MKWALKGLLGNRGGARRGVVAIIVGTLAGQLILAASTPILSRLYPPASYGVFSVILAVASTVAPVATLKFESAVLLPKQIDTARRLLRLSVASALLVSVITGLVIALFPALTSAQLASLPFTIFWTFAMVFTTALYSILSQTALRARNYSVVATRSVTQAAGMAGGQLVLNLATRGPMGLLGGYLIGRCIGFWALVKASKEVFARPAPARGAYRAVAREYWRFPIVFTPSALLNTLGTQLPLLVIVGWFGAASAGELGIAQRLVFIPASLIGVPMGQVFAAEMAQKLRAGGTGLVRIYLHTSLNLTYLAVLVTVLLLFVAPWLLPIFLGHGWEQSGLFAQAMAISVGLGFVVSPVSTVFTLFQRSLPSIIVDGARVVLILGGIGLAAALRTDVVGTAWLLYGALAINYLVTWAYGLVVVIQHKPHPVEIAESAT